ncbi:MFS transporter [Shewanella sp. NFH-SH190041]|uniref:MFS transporter n=1 Tax=Shewanella sp. NFH-SH190041 TaxID=2950245 RepID=UPI0021C348C1|nr:MFS transporter [Shewanella sp. NFH-SH190041]BDM64421.1 MFS transporter [Shewanella sp. NFH-SH190041]
MASLPSQQRAGWLLLLLTLFYGQTFVGRQILAVMIEPVKQEFAATDAQMGLVSGLAFAGVFALLALPAGRLADRSHRPRLLAASALLWSLSTLLCGMAEGFIALVLFRMLVAVAEVPVASASISLISDAYPASKRAFAISRFSSAATFSAVIALSLGAMLIDTLGWRYSFMLIAVLTLPLVILILTLKESRPAPTVATEITETTHGAANPSQATTWQSSLLLLWQLPSVKAIILASALATMGSNAYAMWNAAFLIRSHGLTLQQAGLLAGVIAGGASAAGMLMGGYLADRRHGMGNPLSLAIWGHLLGLSCLILYLLWPSEMKIELLGMPIPAAMLACALAGFFSVFWVGPSFAQLTQRVPANLRATAVALQTMLVTLLGIGAGPFLAGMLSDWLTPSFGIDALRYALILTNSCILISVLLLWRVNQLSAAEMADSAQQAVIQQPSAH